MRRAVRRQYRIGLLLVAAALGFNPANCIAETASTKGAPCLACISIRVGLPHVVRGPAADIADNHFTELRLPNGSFRGFDAHSDTRAIDGRSPSDMGGPERTVLRPGQPGTYDSCGQWLNHVELAGTTVLGFIHSETACHYQANFQTHMSTSLGVSADYGLTWKSYGQILTGTDMPTANKPTGEGSCSTVNGQDGYYYAYCFRNRDGALIVARAPVSNPGPGNWVKFFGGKWDQPGLGGDAPRLMTGSGVSSALWTTTGEMVLTGWVRGGLGLFLSSDHTTLTPLPEPLLAVDPGEWKRPAPSELIFYPVILDDKTGANQLSNSWMLAYAYFQPNEGGNQKYLVFRDVAVSISNAPVSPQIGVLLARWYNAALHDRWSTTAAVPGNDATYKLEARSGYLMTSAPAGQPSAELEDCVSAQGGHPDHLLAQKGFCEAHSYQRLRTAGWVFARQQTNTQPLYQCYSDAEHSHFAANRPDCDGKGRMETLLGYDLVQ
jgi:hypothetical protein